MANNCYFEIKIVGAKEDCYKFIDKMKSYDEPNHFWRIFSIEIFEEGEDHNNNHFILAVGDCAWSIESCCRASGYSNGIDLLKVNTRDLNLDVQIFSQEPGMAFEEEYLYKHGECKIDECNEMTVYDWDLEEYPTYEQLKAAIGPSCPPEEVFDGDDKCKWYTPELQVHWKI